MGKELKGKELGVGISQRSDGFYVGEGYRTSAIYQTRIALFNMLDYAYQNDVIMKNTCNGMVKSDIGKPTQKKEALTLEQQKRFVRGIAGNTYERSEERRVGKEC